MENNNKKTQKYQPTDNQIKVLQAYCDMEVKPTVTARMDKAGVERGCWYDWIKIDGFLEWWHEETEAFMRRSMSELNKIAYMKAGSDFRYMELLQMKYGKFSRNEKTDITSGGEKIQGLSVMDLKLALGESVKNENIPETTGTE